MAQSTDYYFDSSLPLPNPPDYRDLAKLFQSEQLLLTELT